MKIDLDQLRILYQGHVATRRPPNQRRCPSSWVMAGAFDPSLSRKKRRKIADHISKCPYCREEFVMLLEAQRREREQGMAGEYIVTSPTHRAPAQVKWPCALTRIWQSALILIGLCLAISSVFLIIQQNRQPGVPRASAPAIRLISPKADQVLASRPVFRWQNNPACTAYILEIFDEVMLPLWSSEKIHDAEFLLPPEVFMKLVPGRDYYWMVTGFSTDLSTKESSLCRFILRQQ
jgi:hypothetical protein